MAAAKTRPVRPSALRAQNMFGGLTQGGPYGSGSDEDEEYLGGKGVRSTRRLANSGIDFNKLELISLQRYRQAYKLTDQPAASREDLLLAIMRHFGNLYVDEDETLIKFALACRRNGQRMGLGGIGKKPRTGSVKPRGGR